MRKIVFLAAGCAIMMGTAWANGDGQSDAPDRPPEPPATDYRAPAPPERDSGRFDWSGPYVGIQGGWLWGEEKAFEINTPSGVVNDGPLVYDTDGYTVGGVLGINLQSGHWVYGGELDVEYTDLSGQWNWGNGNGLNKDIDVMGSLRGRIGFALDRFLVYGTGGLAVGHVQMEVFDGPPPLITISGDEIPFGYTYGGGVEVALGKHWSAGADYRYTDLGETEHSGEIFEDNFTYRHTNRFHAVRARLIYRMPI